MGAFIQYTALQNDKWPLQSFLRCMASDDRHRASTRRTIRDTRGAGNDTRLEPTLTRQKTAEDMTKVGVEIVLLNWNKEIVVWKRNGAWSLDVDDGITSEVA